VKNPSAFLQPGEILRFAQNDMEKATYYPAFSTSTQALQNMA